MFLLDKKEAINHVIVQNEDVKFSISMKCSFGKLSLNKEKRNYVWITDPRESIRFYIIAKPKISLGLFAKLNFFLSVIRSNLATTALRDHIRVCRSELCEADILR